MVSMYVNLKLDGLPAQVVDEVVEQGIASNKTEAIRMMIMRYNEHFEIEPVNRFIHDERAVNKNARNRSRGRTREKKSS